MRSEGAGGLLDRVVEGRGDLAVGVEPVGVARDTVDCPGAGVIAEPVLARLHRRPEDAGVDLGGVVLVIGAVVEGKR